MFRFPFYIPLLLLTTCLLFSWLPYGLAESPGSRITSTDTETTPRDVYIELQRVSQMINKIGAHMGITQPDILNITVKNAAPHDVYFQARTLALKANRLSFELLRRDSPAPPLPKREVRPEEVRMMVIEAQRAIHDISMEFDLKQFHPIPEIAEEISPSDVFMATTTANRYLNALLERRFAPEEVYSVVNFAISYASNMLAEYPGAMRIPERPPYSKEKRPLDVYYRLYDCLQLIDQIYQIQGLEILEIDITAIQKDHITPSDVLDMASLLVARLDFLSKKLNSRRQAREGCYPGRKFPSDVYQQAAVLQQQLLSLLSLMSSAPPSPPPPGN
jgi:hypothetical protein